MHGERNATADASASPDANAGAVAKVFQDTNSKHQKRKCTMIPIDDSFLNDDSDADGDYTKGGGKVKCGEKAAQVL